MHIAYLEVALKIFKKSNKFRFVVTLKQKSFMIWSQGAEVLLYLHKNTPFRPFCIEMGNNQSGEEGSKVEEFPSLTSDEVKRLRKRSQLH